RPPRHSSPTHTPSTWPWSWAFSWSCSGSRSARSGRERNRGRVAGWLHRRFGNGFGCVTTAHVEEAGMSGAPDESAYVAAVWEHPGLCVALFGVQFHTEDGRRLYEQAGINDELFLALENARGEGLLLNRPLMSPEGPVLLQYWRSYDDLDKWARKQPHSRWW